MRANYLFTSESVAEGHPDKVCDRISDEIVDLIYREASKTGVDPWTVRIACETLATTNRVIIAGEVRVPDTLLKRTRTARFSRMLPATRSSIPRSSSRLPARRSATSATSRMVSTGRRRRSTFSCIRSRRISRRAWTTPPTSRATRVPATRASCSVTPARKRRT